MRRLLREPLLHFLLLGVLLFWRYGWLNRRDSRHRTRSSSRATRWRVCARSSNACGSGRRPSRGTKGSSTTGCARRSSIARRSRWGSSATIRSSDAGSSQKIEFIIDSGTRTTADRGRVAGLARRASGPIPRRVDVCDAAGLFRSRASRRRLDAAVAAAQRALARGRNRRGDSTMLPSSLTGRAAEVERNFGRDFEHALRTLPVGGWQGPVRSGVRRAPGRARRRAAKAARSRSMTSALTSSATC